MLPGPIGTCKVCYVAAALVRDVACVAIGLGSL